MVVYVYDIWFTLEVCYRHPDQYTIMWNPSQVYFVVMYAKRKEQIEFLFRNSVWQSATVSQLAHVSPIIFFDIFWQILVGETSTLVTTISHNTRIIGKCCKDANFWEICQTSRVAKQNFQRKLEYFVMYANRNEPLKCKHKRCNMMYASTVRKDNTVEPVSETVK